MNMLKSLETIMGPRKSPANLLKNKNDVLFDIDWQGTQQLIAPRAKFI